MQSAVGAGSGLPVKSEFEKFEKILSDLVLLWSEVFLNL